MNMIVDNLTCARGGVSVLENLSFAVAPGQVLLLRGPNGIGKTTLLRTLAGLQPAIKGSVNVDPDQIAYAAHADAIKPTLTVTENLDFWAAIYGKPNSDGVLSGFDLEGLATRQAQNLSAGQKRRLGLARLLLTGRAIWLLDEPTVSLDQNSVNLFVKAIRKHCSTGGSALIATHIDLGVTAETLDLTSYRARLIGGDVDDGVFL